MFTQVSKRQLHRTLLSFLLIIALISAMIMSSVIPSHAAGGAALLAAFTESAVAVVAAHPVAACILVTLAIGAGVGAASNSYALEGLAQDLLSKIPADLLSVLDGLSDVVLSGSFSITSLISAGATDLMSWFITWLNGLSASDNVPITFDLGNGQLWKGDNLKTAIPNEKGELTYFVYNVDSYWVCFFVERVTGNTIELGIRASVPKYNTDLSVSDQQVAYGTDRPYDIKYEFLDDSVRIYGDVCGRSMSSTLTASDLSSSMLWDDSHISSLFSSFGSGTVLPDSTFFPTSDSGQALIEDQPLTIPRDVQSAVGATAPDVRVGDIVVDPPIAGDTSGTITGEGGGTGVFEGVGNWILNIPILGDILAALQSIISQLQQLLSSDLPEELQSQIEVFRDALVDKLALNQFTQSFAAFQQMQTGYGTAPKITLNLHALANTAQQVGSFSNTFPDEESVVIDFSFLEDERFKFMDLTLIDLIRALGSLAMVMSTALYCYKKITSGDVIG